jgi:hypothetical protein
VSDEGEVVPMTPPVKRKPGRPRKVAAESGSEDIALLKAQLKAAQDALAAVGQKAPVVDGSGRFSAYFDRSSMKQVGKTTQNVLDHFTDPDDPEFQKLVDQSARGYCQIHFPDGRPCRGFETSAMMAQATMRNCIEGRFNPDPPVKISKRQDLGAPVPVKAGV